MTRGIIYIMETAVDGLIKIGRTASKNFEQRMYNLEHHGYCNVVGLKRRFAIEVEDYERKEYLLQNIFAKSQLGKAELFALDVDIAIELLSAFEGKVIYPYTQNSEVPRLVPDGTYLLKRMKKSDNRDVIATAAVKDDCWTLLKGSILGVHEDKGVSVKARSLRADMKLNEHGRLLEDFELGLVSPSCAGTVALNQSSNGWDDWKNIDGETIDIYRKGA